LANDVLNHLYLKRNFTNKSVPVVFFHATFCSDLCHKNLNVTSLRDACARSHCFYNGTNASEAASQCSVCSSTFIQQHIAFCKAKGACKPYQEAIGCDIGR